MISRRRLPQGLPAARYRTTDFAEAQWLAHGARCRIVSSAQEETRSPSNMRRARFAAPALSGASGGAAGFQKGAGSSTSGAGSRSGCREVAISTESGKDRGRAGPYTSRMALISRQLTASFANSNVPWSRISRAARRKAPKAARERALPTLTRLTPSFESSARLRRTPCSPITTLTRDRVLEVGPPSKVVLHAPSQRESKGQRACRIISSRPIVLSLGPRENA
jgi:hypothetical protein